MGMLIAILSLFNIALGYGLAVYLRRTIVQPVQATANSPKSSAETTHAVVDTELSETTTRESPDSVIPATVAEELTDGNKSEELEQASDLFTPAETVAQHLESMSEENSSEETANIEESQPAVDEENVLAGIEAFRAQLAQMKDESSAQSVEEVNPV